MEANVMIFAGPSALYCLSEDQARMLFKAASDGENEFGYRYSPEQKENLNRGLAILSIGLGEAPTEICAREFRKHVP